jgi:hypothetical protein
MPARFEPNLFTTGAPLAPAAALCNMTTCLQHQVDWFTGCIAHLRARGLTEIEPTRQMRDERVKNYDDIANADNTSTLRTGALHCYRLPASRLLLPRSGPERSDFVLWPISARLIEVRSVGDCVAKHDRFIGRVDREV